ncbi:MAG: zf-HC2 domain-containing protein [Anaerolineaceae bacterium]|nr:zf-HC2 domain-containing protein [Anaerolineaceae bacterium]
MKPHEFYNQQLPDYLSGNLSHGEEIALRAHIATCADCRADLALWQSSANAVREANRPVMPPAHLAVSAFQTIHAHEARHWTIADLWQLVLAQIPLIRKEIWSASLLVILIGLIISLIFERNAFLYFLAPLIAASGLSVLFTPQDDPALELVASTPSSRARILLARVSLVFGYNLLLAVLSMVALSFYTRETLTSQMILEWLAPVALLASLALFLSLLTSSHNAVFIAYSLWLLRFFVENRESLQGFGEPSPLFHSLASWSRAFWANPLIPILIAGVVFSAALLFADQRALRPRTSKC